MQQNSSNQNSGGNPRAPGDATTADVAATQPYSPGRSNLLEGSVFGQYRLIRQVGRGGSADVWEAESVLTQRRLAVKVLTPMHRSSAQSLERFKREAKLASSVNHPRCVFIFGAEEIDGYPVITMELMRGGTLQDQIAKNGPMPAREAIDKILDVIEGLEASFAQGILHRDIKPSNCFLDETGRAKIGDFGISRTLDTPSALTVTGGFLGTPAYSSPEQVRGREMGLHSDIYSVGATLYALLAGVPPFQGNSAGEVLARIAAEAPTPFSAYPVRVPREVQRIVMRTLSKDKERRFQTYAELRAALLPFSSSGLTASSLPKRFVAFQIDNLVLIPILFALSRWLDNSMPHALVQALVSLVPIAYFSLSEKRWGRTIGKHLLGLRVTLANESPLSYSHAFLRTGILLITTGVLGRLINTLPSTPLRALEPLTFLLMFFTMRAKNGYAGLHELLSNTRVMDVRKREPILVPRLSLPSSKATSEGKQHGPYRILETIWTRGSDALFLAHDDLVDRSVWIHEYSGENLQPMAALAELRPTRLRWLQGSREERSCWDAYEAPSGVGFYEWVVKSRRLGWVQVRSVLLDVATEFKALLELRHDTQRFTLRHIWIDSNGNSRLLNFPSSAGGTDREFTAADGPLFLRLIACFGLTGESRLRADSDSASPPVPMPEHARLLIRSIGKANGGVKDLGVLIEELQNVQHRPTRVTRIRRFIPMLLPFSPVLFTSISIALLLLFPTLSSMGILSPILSRQYTESREFQAALDPNQINAMRTSQIRLVIPAQTVGFFYFGILSGIFSLVLTAILGIIPLLGLCGITLQTDSGRPAGRWRCVLRSAIAWAPFLVSLAVALFHDSVTRDPRNPLTFIPSQMVGAIIAIVLVGAAYALARPDRGIPDVIAGTHLVPR